MKSNFAFLCVGDVDAGVKEEVRACALYRAENPFGGERGPDREGGVGRGF